jgi:repressor LexA
VVPLSAVDKLTNAQARVLDAIRSRIDAGQPSPTYRELQSELGFQSTASVRDHLRALERKGFVTLGEGRFRSVRLVRHTAHATQVPVLGRVVAGHPTPAQEELEGFVEVPSRWVRGDTFALNVVGDSMRDAGILEGDIAVLRRDITPWKGQIVCATVDGETTLKIFEPRDDDVWLVPANSAYRPIRLTDNSVIQGVLQLTLRVYSQKGVESSNSRSVSMHARVSTRNNDGTR